MQPHEPDPLFSALRRKALEDTSGGTEDHLLAAGEGWRVVDVVCTSGPQDPSFEETHLASSVSLVLAGTFTYRGNEGRSLMAPGVLLLGDAGHCFECSHRH